MVSHVQIKNDIGKLFRKYNICEFKNPRDSFSVNDYAKSIGYASLYSSFKNAPMTEITITIVLTMYPREVVRFLKNKRGLTVQDQGNGVHYVLGDVYPMQIIETKKLSKDNLFLKNIRTNLNLSEMQETILALNAAGVSKRDIYFEGIVNANPDTFREVMNMNDEIMEIIFEVAEKTGRLDKIRQTDKEEIAKKMLSRGTLVEIVAEDTGLPYETVKSIANALSKNLIPVNT